MFTQSIQAAFLSLFLPCDLRHDVWILRVNSLERFDLSHYCMSGGSLSQKYGFWKVKSCVIRLNYKTSYKNTVSLLNWILHPPKQVSPFSFLQLISIMTMLLDHNNELLDVPVKCRLYWKRQRWRCAGSSRRLGPSERPMTSPPAGRAEAGTLPGRATGSTCCLRQHNN